MAEHGLIVFRTETDGIYEMDLGFVHGLHGDSVKTWSKKGILWPEIFSQMVFQMRDS